MASDFLYVCHFGFIRVLGEGGIQDGKTPLVSLLTKCISNL